MYGLAWRPAKDSIDIRHPFAGMIRIRFEGSPHCLRQRSLSPLSGLPLVNVPCRPSDAACHHEETDRIGNSRFETIKPPPPPHRIAQQPISEAGHFLGQSTTQNAAPKGGVLQSGNKAVLFTSEKIFMRFADLAATYSPASLDEVPSALGRFTAVFGMGTGAAAPP